MKKKAQSFGIGSIVTVVVIFVIVAIAAIYSMDIMEDTRETFCDYTYDEVDDLCVSCPAAYPSYNSTANNCYNSSGGTTAYVDQRVASFNSTTDAMSGVAKVPAKMPTLGNVVIAAVIIGVLLAAFGGFLTARRFRM